MHSRLFSSITAALTMLAYAALLSACGESLQKHIADEPGSSSRNILTSDASVASSATHSRSGWLSAITFYVSASAPDHVVDASVQAAQSWNDAVGFELLTYAGRGDGVNQSSLYSSLADQRTVIYWDENWIANTGKASTTLGTTVWENDAGDDTIIVKGDIILNAQSYSFVDASVQFEDLAGSRKALVDAESVILHEMGHLIGLDHVRYERDPDSVMPATTYIGQGVFHRKLSDGDVERARNIYVK